MEDFDDEVEAQGGADDGDQDGLTGGLRCWSACRWGRIGFVGGDESLHGG